MENNEIKGNIYTLLSKLKELWAEHKAPICITASVLILCITASSVTAFALHKKSKNTLEANSEISQIETVESILEQSEVSEPTEASSVQEPIVIEPAASSKTVSSAEKKPTVKKEQTVSTSKPAAADSYKYNSNSDIEDNIFLDALIYTGYNINKHRADGKMWQYILASQKRGLGYLSKITYAGGSSGYETANGKPDIKYFEKHGLVCASYVTYVYFNYLPNVAGIDTSALPKPARSTSANDWYTALKQWIDKGYSRRISFTASKTSSGFINFKASEEIPIGSIIVCCDARNRSDYGSHVSIYAGYKNNYNWITHVGNANGPEFCAIERLHFGPDPQWPIAVITPPSNIRFSAMLEVNVTDGNGKPVSGAAVSLKNSKTGAIINLGTSNGKTLTKEGLSYGDYTVNFTVPAGYVANSTTQTVKLTTANNSKNTANIILAPIPPAQSSAEQSSSNKTESAASNPSASPSQGQSSESNTLNQDSSAANGSSLNESSSETVSSSENNSEPTNSNPSPALTSQAE